MKGKIELCKVEVLNETGDTMLTYCMKRHCVEIEILKNIGDAGDYLLTTLLESIKIRFEQYDEE